jgi:hypothetical protein
VIWLSPVPFTARGNAGLGVSVVFLAACWMTTLLLPIHCGDLVNRRPPGPELLPRKPLPVLLWGLLLLLPLNIQEEKETR